MNPANRGMRASTTIFAGIKESYPCRRSDISYTMLAACHAEAAERLTVPFSKVNLLNEGDLRVSHCEKSIIISPMQGIENTIEILKRHSL